MALFSFLVSVCAFTKQQAQMNQYNPFEVAESVDVVTEPAAGKVYGGIRRSPYFAYLFFGYILVLLVSFGLGAAMVAGGAAPAGAISLGALVPAILYQVLSIWVTAKRLQNLGYSGWWVLGMIVPILNIAVGVKCMAAPEGYADHKTLDTAGKIIIGLFLATIVLFVGALLRS